MFNRFVLILFLLFSHTCFSQVIDPAFIDSLRQKVQVDNLQEKEYIDNCFSIADAYMEISQYDSAQIWLNNIHALVPVKTNSLSNYFLVTRQAEVYYYNNLQQMGLQESRRGLEIAEALNDSLLLADSYNFLGLFYVNIDSVQQAIPYFQKGLLYTRQPPYPPQYLSLSKPHHLHGNLAEAFFKLGRFDSSLAHYKQSLRKAQEINWGRGIAVAYTGLGDVYFELNQIDSSLKSYEMGRSTALQSNDNDVALLCYGGMAKCYLRFRENNLMNEELENGFALLNRYPQINRLFALLFLDNAIALYKEENNASGLLNALENKSRLENIIIKGHNDQIQAILDASLSNEKRILNMEVDEARKSQQLANTRLLMAIGAFVLLSIIFLINRYYQNQKLGLSFMRQKISQDLHDEVGSTLSSIHIYSSVAVKAMDKDPVKAQEALNNIRHNTHRVMDNMSDIVWAINTGNLGDTTFGVKLKNYGYELLTPLGIQCKYEIEPEVERRLVNIEARKNVLLIAKEAMNNIAKYSQAKNALIKTIILNNKFVLEISDDGNGFDIELQPKGNGLKNMQIRAESLGGVIRIASGISKGTVIHCEIPVANISD